MPSIEFEAAAMQLEALGFIKVTEDNEGLGLTDRGSERAAKIMADLPVDDRLLLTILCFDYIKDHPQACMTPEED